MIRFSANIRIVSKRQFWRRLPGMNPEKNKATSCPYELKNHSVFGRKRPLTKRYTDSAYDCCILYAGSPKLGKGFHLRPSQSVIKALPWQLPKLLENFTHREATITGGIPFYEESTTLKNTIESVLLSNNFSIRKLWGKGINVGVNAYMSKSGTIWVSLGENPPTRPFSRRVRTFDSPASVQPKNTMEWLHNTFREITLLPGDKLFIGNAAKPILEGPYSCGRVAF